MKGNSMLVLVGLVALVLPAGCKKKKKDSGVKMTTIEFMLDGATLKMKLGPGLRKSTCAGCLVYEGGGTEVYVKKMMDSKVPKTMADAVKMHGGKAGTLKKQKLKRGFLVSSPSKVLVIRVIGSYNNSYFCRVTNSSPSKEEQSLGEKMCLSMFNPYQKDK